MNRVQLARVDALEAHTGQTYTLRHLPEVNGVFRRYSSHPDLLTPFGGEAEVLWNHLEGLFTQAQELAGVE